MQKFHQRFFLEGLIPLKSLWFLRSTNQEWNFCNGRLDYTCRSSSQHYKIGIRLNVRNEL
jgi:hypothetical protein